eukprot:Awhi_evm1s2169
MSVIIETATIKPRETSSITSPSTSLRKVANHVSVQKFRQSKIEEMEQDTGVSSDEETDS